MDTYIAPKPGLMTHKPHANRIYATQQKVLTHLKNWSYTELYNAAIDIFHSIQMVWIRLLLYAMPWIHRIITHTRYCLSAAHS